ncbi:MAG: ABC transporter permease [Gammaproteobacteria bacterium]|nr:MAG: ABC transporter permease [Gammaproteobacteria bacterium]
MAEKRPLVRTIAAFTCLEAARDRLFLILLAVLVAGLGLAQFVGAIAITERSALQGGLLGAGLRLFVVSIVCLFVIASNVREEQGRFTQLLFSLPLPRYRYYFGKLLGYGLVAAMASLLAGMLLLLHAPWPVVLLWTISLLCETILMATVALACLFTFRNILPALSAVAAFYLLARSIDALQLIAHGPLRDPGDPAQRVMAAVIDGLAWLLPSLARFTPSGWLIHAEAGWSDLSFVLGQTLVYSLLMVGVGLFDLYRRPL